ncbi:MAG: Spo0B domain-containing protein [Bacillota bacterium]|jgi:sensor histidine kinase regulating citrate/malate metabolism
MEVKDTDRTIFDNVVNLICDQRHDYLNCLQVIMGKLQLSKPDKALEYLRKVTSDMLETNIITKLGNSYLTLFLLFAVQKSKNTGMDLTIIIESGSAKCKDYKKETIDFLYNILMIAIDYISIIEGEQNWIRLTLKEKDERSVWEFAMAPTVNCNDLFRELRKIEAQLPSKFGYLSIDEVHRLIIFTI